MKNRHRLLVISCMSAVIPSLLQAQTPPTWTSRDIGSVGVAGSSTEAVDGGNFTVTGAGANLWDTSDSFRFVSQTITGSDVQITARVVSIQNTSPYAKAGLMVRQGNATTSANDAILVSPGDGLYFQSRATSGALTTRPAIWPGSAPKWLKLIYSGGYAVGYSSDNGAQWDRLSATRMSLTSPFLAGVAVTSRTTAHSCLSVFENVQVTPASTAIFGAFPNAWSIENFGTVPTPGQGAYDAAAGTILVTGMGTGVTGTANTGAFLHRTWYGDGAFVVRVADAALLSTSGKTGLTMSQSSANGSVCVNLYLTGGNQAVLSVRSIANGTTATIATGTSIAAPRWLKLERTGDQFTASTSANGATWAVLGTTTVAMGTPFEAGLVAASGSTTVASTAAFDGLSCSGADGNENGLLDAWETAMFGNLKQEADGNPDADGLTNAQEQALGTNPLIHDDPATVRSVPAVPVTLTPVSKQGVLERSVWTNISGLRVKDLTQSAAFAGAPAVRDLVTPASVPTNFGSNFGQRLRGTITAPVSGNYTFWICADDAGELWLGTSDSRFSKKRIAWLNSWTTFQNWDANLSQKSVTIPLEGGKKYWIEALGKEGTGSDHLSVAWEYPNQAREVISAQYLASPRIDSNDTNDNNLPDDWEVANSVTGGEYGDSDNDGLTNFEESYYGTDPNERAGVPGYLNRDVWRDLGGNWVSTLLRSPSYLLEPWSRDLWAGASYAPAENILDNYGQRMRGTITAPVSGGYIFWIAGNNGCELWLSSDERKFKKQRIASSDTAESYGNFAALTTQKSAPVELRAGQKYYIEILLKDSTGSEHVEIAWQIPGQSRVIVPPQYVASFVKELDDADEDDMPDSWETTYGLNPADNGATDIKQASYSDYDGDGVSNRDEYLAGTNPKSADSFGDGIKDADRTFLSGTNPLLGGAVLGDLTGNLTGTAFSSASSNWYGADDTVLVSTSRRGSVEYTFTTQTDGRSLARIRGSARGNTSGTAELPLRLSVDGLLLGTVTLKSTSGSEAEVVAMLPWLSAGSHVLKIESLNTYASVSLQLNSVLINALTGEDANGDGIPDWAHAEATAQNGFTLPASAASPTSPVCVEGTATYPGIVKLSKSGTDIPVEAGANDGWYANVAFGNATETTLTAVFENGLHTANRTFTWVPTNVLSSNSTSMTIRINDSLRLTAYPEGSAAAGSANLTITSPTGTVTTINTEATAPVVKPFTQSGVYTIRATHTLNGQTTSGNSTLTVRSADFGSAFPLFVNRSRLWKLPSVLPVLPVEYDERLFFSVASATSGSAFNVNSSLLGDFNVLARTSGDGPILDKGSVHVFDVASTTTTGDSQVVYVFPNGDRLVRMGVVVTGLPPGATVVLDISANGVTFPDGTTTLVLHSSDFDENGVAYVVFNYPKDVLSSVCHSLKVYDANGTLIGSR